MVLTTIALDQCRGMAIYRLPLPADDGGPPSPVERDTFRSYLDTSRVFVTHISALYAISIAMDGLIVLFLTVP